MSGTRLNKTLGVIAGSIVLIIVGIVADRDRATAQVQKPPEPVMVVNTTAEPVPTMAQGTTNVNVVNTPTVNVGSLPAVSLAPGAMVGIGNTASVHSVDEPALQPFQRFAGTTVSIPAFNVDVLLESLTVPSGKRAVIEYVEGRSDNLAAGQTLSVTVETNVGGEFASYKFGGRKVGAGATAGTEIWSVNERTRLYSDPGSIVHLRISLTGTALASGFVNAGISGYFVNVP